MVPAQGSLSTFSFQFLQVSETDGFCTAGRPACPFGIREISLSGKRFQFCMESLFEMIVHRQFHGVELHTFTDLHQGTNLSCTPRCVCRAHCAAPAPGHRRAQIRVRLGDSVALACFDNVFDGILESKALA